LTCIGARKGSRPRKPRDPGYEWARIFGAVCPAHAEGATIVMPYADTEAMNEHTLAIRARFAGCAHGVVVMDGAGWHFSKTLVIPSDLSLDVQPPYAPELNPVENVWQYLRQNHLAIRTYETYEAIRDTCCEAWKALMALPQRITSITTRKWANAS